MLTLDYDRLGLRPGERVLDIGCGEGRHSFEAYRRGASLVVALDLDAGAVTSTARMLRTMRAEGEAGRQAAAVNGDANRLPFPDAAFDRVICSETLEHIDSDRVAIAELARVLRPGGRVGISVPRRFPEQVCWALSREYRETPGGHVRIYRASQLERAVAATGLTSVGRHHAHALHSPYWWVRCVLGAPEDGAWLSRQYERLLVWDIEHAPTSLSTAERLLNPLLGKSVVLYFDRPVIARSEKPGTERPQPEAAVAGP
ncbi:MAG: methyltransferase domain-containing protein [Dehalococcoidia bacterium]|nr:methyltransferase domain-containing protein [Dehalococcoidia bacterium]